MIIQVNITKIEFDTLESDGYTIKRTPEGYHLMNIGNEQFYVQEPTDKELKEMFTIKDDLNPSTRSKL